MFDGGLEIDIDAVNRTIDEAQIISLFFPLLRKTLLLDTRLDGDAGAFVRVVEMVNDPRERFHSLGRLRPRLPRPQSISTIPWTRRVSSLRESGVWEHLLARFDDCGDERCRETAEACIEELERFERLELQRAITGEFHRTLWGRRGLGDTEPHEH